MKIAEGVSLKEKVVDYICQEITKGNYKPKEQIKEIQIANELNISRAPVREALNELVHLGILMQFPRRGVFVKETTPSNILNTYKTKGLVEGFLATEFVLRATKEDFTKLDWYIQKIKQSVYNLNNSLEIGDEFHKFYLKYATNEILLDTLKRVNKKSQILFHQNWARLYTPKEIVNRHKKIADVLKSKDNEAVEEVIRDHYFETGMKIALEYQNG